jgi:hypothetical protein
MFVDQYMWEPWGRLAVRAKDHPPLAQQICPEALPWVIPIMHCSTAEKIKTGTLQRVVFRSLQASLAEGALPKLESEAFQAGNTYRRARTYTYLPGARHTSAPQSPSNGELLQSVCGCTATSWSDSTDPAGQIHAAAAYLRRPPPHTWPSAGEDHQLLTRARARTSKRRPWPSHTQLTQPCPLPQAQMAAQH